MTDAHLEFIQSLGFAPESVAAASHPIDEIDRRNKQKMSFLSIFDFLFSGANYCVSSQIEALTGIAFCRFCAIALSLEISTV
jgi:hypothetical protein